uniref:Hcy-binding domain-containing protein n=1 Tax=Strongyloides venezuelensis TaxID=75913 RepID=A0A0K0EVD8_STRVS
MQYRILDGGLGTTIQKMYSYNRQGNKTYIDHGFFSFNLIIDRKLLELANVHMEFLKNYSETLFTSHYQASIPRLYKKLVNLNEIWILLKISYEIPKCIMKFYGNDTQNVSSFPSVIVSCGPIATYFQNKCEYYDPKCHPLYKNGIYENDIVDMYYKIQVQSLISLSPECIMFETFSLYDEIKSLINVLNSLPSNVYSNICFGLSITCKDEKVTFGGCNIVEIFVLVSESRKFKYFGINCTYPKCISKVLQNLSIFNCANNNLEIVIKSNKGDIMYENGLPHVVEGAKMFFEYVDEWSKILPIAGIGGCCGVLPEDIGELHRRKNNINSIIENQSMVKEEDLKFLIEKVICDSEESCSNKHLGVEVKDLEKFYELVQNHKLE